MGRFSMFRAWYDFVKGIIHPNREFVSVDVKIFTKDPRSYDLLSKDLQSRTTPDVPLTPLSPAPKGLRDGRSPTPDYFGRDAKYEKRTTSFSSPRAPQVRDWSPSAGADLSLNHRIDPLGMNKI